VVFVSQFRAGVQEIDTAFDRIDEKLDIKPPEIRFFHQSHTCGTSPAQCAAMDLTVTNSQPEKSAILIVENEPDCRRLLIEMLRGFDLNCLAAESNAEGLSLLQSNRISLVLLDWELADGLGSRFLQVAKKQHPLLPVVVMSGKLYDVRTDAMVEQADAFLSKPWNATVLTNQVNRLLKLSEAANQGLFPKKSEDILPLAEIKTAYIRRAVQLLDGNVSLTAERLDVHRQTVAAALKPWVPDQCAV
jgi:DNA-binding response OmpR family regulator